MTKILSAVPAGQGNHLVHAYAHQDLPGLPLVTPCGLESPSPAFIRVIQDTDDLARCPVCYPTGRFPVVEKPVEPGIVAVDKRPRGWQLWNIRWRLHGYDGPVIFNFTCEAPTKQAAEEALAYFTNGRAQPIHEGRP